MATVNYPHPVTVNGFSCKNCTDVDNAKRHIDPQHPQDGPYGVNAPKTSGDHGPAVTFGGALAGTSTSAQGAGPGPAPAASGTRLDLTA
jgi:hypothetical protein